MLELWIGTSKKIEPVIFHWKGHGKFKTCDGCVRQVTESYRSCTFADIWYYSKYLAETSMQWIAKKSWERNGKILESIITKSLLRSYITKKGVAIKKSTISMRKSLAYFEFQLTLQTIVKEREGGLQIFLSPVYRGKPTQEENNSDRLIADSI